MIKIGVLGAAGITPAALLEPAAGCEEVSVVAVAASSNEKAEAFAEAHHIPHVYGSYDAVINAPDIDLIYNPLPPNVHKEWTIKALRAGKHVLCEKPFAMDESEAVEMVGVAAQQNRILIEAFHYRFHPVYERVLQLVQSGIIGNLQHISAEFNVYIPYDAHSLRHNAKLGGGVLMDLGCYPLHWVRTITGEEPTVVAANILSNVEQIDLTTEAELLFPSNTKAHIACSMAEEHGAEHVSKISITGSDGKISLDNPISPHIGNTLVIDSKQRQAEESINAGTTYLHQLKHVLKVLKGQEKQITGGEDAIANMRLIDAVYRKGGLLTRAEAATR